MASKPVSENELVPTLRTPEVADVPAVGVRFRVLLVTVFVEVGVKKGAVASVL